MSVGFQARTGSGATGTNVLTTLLQRYKAVVDVDQEFDCEGIIFGPGSGLAVQILNGNTATLTINAKFRATVL